MMELKGKLISAMGIPGSGKSSVIKELANLYQTDAVVFNEPEESDSKFPWPKAVSSRQEYGYFGSVTWFRSMRVPLLYDAAEVASIGKLALIDSYYDKLLYNYIGREGLDWFLPRDDEYYNIIKGMAKKDYECLPNADIVIYFKISKSLWKDFLLKRNRNMDRELEFEKQCFSLQDPLLEACHKYAKDFNKKVIIFDQFNSSPLIIAKNLKKLLEESL